MEIKSLHATPIEEMIHCFNQSFAGYFVPMPTEVSFWAGRFATTGVDYQLSFGVFDGDKLVAFIIQAVAKRAGERIAFNTGTGVLPDYRGQRWIDRLYAYAIPRLREREIDRCQLEVIDLNRRAIRVYERIGFRRDRYLKCYNGNLFAPASPDLSLAPATLPELKNFTGLTSRYSWDFATETLARSPQSYLFQKVFRRAAEDHWVGYFALKSESDYVVQLEALPGHWPYVLAGIRQHCASVKLNNVAAERTELIGQLERAGLQNTVNQYEMSLEL